MDLQFSGASAEFETIIGQARDRMEDIIIGDLPDVTLDTADRPTPCGLSSMNIDDIEVCVIIEELPRNILGIGGVRFVRTNDEGTLLPVTGQVSIDRSAHENNPTLLRSTAEHELLHALGVGILFDTETYKLAGEFVLNSGGLEMPDAGTCYYSGTSSAAARFQILSGCPPGTTIPMTRSCGHWSEQCFNNIELMGPYGGPAISDITIGSLEDLGYEVDFSQADRLFQSDLSPLCRCALLEDEVGEPDQTPADTEEAYDFDLNRALAIRYGLQVMREIEEAELDANNQGLVPLEELGLRDLGGTVISVMYLDDDGNVRDVIVKR